MAKAPGQTPERGCEDGCVPQINEDPEGYWNDEAASKWVRAQASVDRMVQPITGHLLETADVKPGERVLDVGCGCGTTTLAFGEAVGTDGHVRGIDISRPMLAEAQQRGEGTGNLSFVAADAGRYDFSSETYDLLASRFGVMFFPDPKLAFANLHRALAEGGRTAFAVWQGPAKNPWITFILEAFPEVEPPLPAPDQGPGPFSLSDREQTAELLSLAGFTDVRVESFETRVTLGDSVDQALEGMRDIGPLSRILGEAEDDKAKAAIEERARSFLEQRFESGPPKLDAAVWMLNARR